MRRLALALLLALLVPLGSALADPAPDATDWDAVEAAARGQTVHFYAWGGESHINDYIAWVGEELAASHDLEVVHVKLADTAEAVARVLAETVAGRTEGGAVDLVWINGENFAAMKGNDLLWKGGGAGDGDGDGDGDGWAEALPNRKLVDLEAYGAAILNDFGVPVDGQQSPWGRAQLVYLYDEARTPEPPKSLDALVEFARQNPGRFTYPQPPSFLGTSFLKQVLLDAVPDPSVLHAPAGEEAEALVRSHLLPVLNALHPNLWRSGRAFPQGVAELRRLFADGEIALALTHNPSDAEVAIRAGLLPPSVRIGAFEDGTIGNVHFVAIPHNANDKAGALIVANFLLSPEAQARKADAAYWGDPSVLDLNALSADKRALFGEEVAVDAPTLQEPHASWTKVIEAVWADAFLS